jgi:transposase
MERLYEGISNRILSELESDEAVRLYLALPASMSQNSRHEKVAAQMSYDTRKVSRFQVRRAMQRYEENGGATAMSKRHVNRKIKAIAPEKRRKSRHAMPLSTKTAIIQWALSVCTMTGSQIRDEIHSDEHGLWGYSTITRIRREAGMTRKRTTPAKREACPVQQHMHADQLINLGYLPEHFIFIDETHKAAKDWYLQYGYSWSGCPARVELEGPINLTFSTLAAMTLDGMIGMPMMFAVHSTRF